MPGLGRALNRWTATRKAQRDTAAGGTPCAVGGSDEVYLVVVAAARDRVRTVRCGNWTKEALEDSRVPADYEGVRLEKAGRQGVRLEFREVVVVHGMAQRDACSAKLKRRVARDNQDDSPWA